MRRLDCRFTIVFTFVCCLGVGTASAEDYILKMEDLVYREADLQAVKELFAGGSGFDNPATGRNIPRSEIVQTIEIRIRSGATFYSKARIGERNLTVSGELLPANTPGQFLLHVDRIEWKTKEPSGQTPITQPGQAPPPPVNKNISLRPQIEVGKTVALGPFAEVSAVAKTGLFAKKGTYVVHTLRLEPVDAPK